MSTGTSAPTCSFCGAKPVFRGQTNCQSCGKDLTGRKQSESAALTPPAQAVATSTSFAPLPEHAP